jgi:hypothetical protein
MWLSRGLQPHAYFESGLQSTATGLHYRERLPAHPGLWEALAAVAGFKADQAYW